uniref:K Homology domain-containing protein n=1 Tax=Plectus sambesii TaxID=2011161 RepID=A0A914XGV0_9BILA
MGENSVIDCGQSTPTNNNNNNSNVVTSPTSTSPTSNNELDSSGSSASGVGAPNGCHNSAGSPASTTTATAYSVEYLAQLLKDKKQLAAFPNVFHHIERLIDEEINKVRVALFQFEFTKDTVLTLPDAEGEIVTIQEKVFVPAKEYPDYNFVGRILGPRGMTAKQLEQETGCKIMVRGKGSMRDKKKEDGNRGKPNWEHLQDELHVLVQCEDTDNRAKVKLMRAVQEVRKLLVPAPEGEDELKRKQLMELAIINGTYRPANQSKIAMHTPRLLTPMSLPSPMRSPTLGAPIILSPTRGPGGLAGMQPITPCSSMSAINLTGYGHSNPNSLQQSPLVHASPSVDYATGQLFINSFDPAFMQSMQQMQAAAAANNGYQQYAAAAAMLGTPFLGADYQQAVDMQAGQLIRHHC